MGWSASSTLFSSNVIAWGSKKYPCALTKIFLACKSKAHTLFGFWNSIASMTFSMAHFKQLFSKYCQNNLLVKIFSHILTQNACLLGFSDLSVVFSTFYFLPVHSQFILGGFPWSTFQFQDFPSSGKWNYTMPWLSSFSLTHTNPEKGGKDNCAVTQNANPLTEAPDSVEYNSRNCPGPRG